MQIIYARINKKTKHTRLFVSRFAFHDYDTKCILLFSYSICGLERLKYRLFSSVFIINITFLSVRNSEAIFCVRDFLTDSLRSQRDEIRSTVGQFNGATRNDRYQSKCRWTRLFIDNLPRWIPNHGLYSLCGQYFLPANEILSRILFVNESRLKRFRWRKIRKLLIFEKAKIEWYELYMYACVYVALDNTFEDLAFKPDRCRRTIHNITFYF